MALVKCPECGTDNVSDTATSCPNCGCNVKAYLDQVRYNQEIKEYKQQRASSVPLPPEPKKNTASIAGYSLLLVIAAILIFIAIGALTNDSVVMFIVFMLFGLAIGSLGFIFLNDSLTKSKRARALYDYAITHKEEYINSVLDEEIKRAQYAQSLRCPVCGSNQIKRIGAGDRMAGVFMAGLASSKIGKQYQCLKCGHKW